MMAALFRPAERQHGMLPEHRSAGMMPWIIAIMLFLTALASWCGLSLASASASLASDLDNRLTVQLAEPNPRLREGQVRALSAELPKLAMVDAVERVDERQMQRMLEPWLGDVARDADIPMPVLFDVTLNQPVSKGLAPVAKLASEIAPGAKVTADAEWLAPATELLAALKWLALGLLLLMALATAAVVVMAVRAALNTHEETISIMHLMGATDRQISQLFERQIARDTLLGGIVGVVLSLLAIIPLATRLAALGGGMPGSGGVRWWLLPLLALIPLAAVLLAKLVARRTVLSSLDRKL